jgi:hypothetical protein
MKVEIINRVIKIIISKDKLIKMIIDTIMNK